MSAQKTPIARIRELESACRCAEVALKLHYPESPTARELAYLTQAPYVDPEIPWLSGEDREVLRDLSDEIGPSNPKDGREPLRALLDRLLGAMP